jgi:mRNA-degrading endonuclease RelE of RelBE toxin-antitoxin system
VRTGGSRGDQESLILDVFFRAGNVSDTRFFASFFLRKKIFIIIEIDLIMVYAVYTTESFDRETLKLTKDEQERIKKIYLQLKENSYVGDQLQYKHLREKRIKEKRIYYLVYDDLQAVLVVTVSGKKNQQATINHIIDNFDEYKEYLERLLKED